MIILLAIIGGAACIVALLFVGLAVIFSGMKPGDLP